MHLRYNHEDVEENVEVAEVRVRDLVLQAVEHVLHPLVSAVDGFAHDENDGEADHECSLFGRDKKMNTVFSQYLIFHVELKFQWVEQEYSVFITFPCYFPSF